MMFLCPGYNYGYEEIYASVCRLERGYFSVVFDGFILLNTSALWGLDVHPAVPKASSEVGSLTSDLGAYPKHLRATFSFSTLSETNPHTR